MVTTRSKKTDSKPPASIQVKPAEARKVKDKVGSPSARARRGIAAKALIASSRSPSAKALIASVRSPSPAFTKDSSDEFNYSDEEDEARPSIGYASDTSQTSSVSQRQKLPFNLQRSLLLDIFEQGGIQHFDKGQHLALSKLCDKRKNLYGERGDPLREKIGKKVVRWKKVHREEPLKWKTLLLSFQINETSLPYQSEQEAEQDDRKPAALPRKTTKIQTSRPPSFPTSSINIPFASLPVKTNKTASTVTTRANDPESKMTSIDTKPNTMWIKVNKNDPEANGPFLIYDVPDFPGAKNGKELRAFYILLQVDHRYQEWDESVNWFSAHVAGSHQVYFKVPAWYFTLYPKTPNAELLYNSILDQVDPSVRKSMNHAHSIFDPTNDNELSEAEIEDRKWKYFMLDFSDIEGIGELSSKAVFDDAGKKDDLDFDYIEVPLYFDHEKNQVTHNETWLGFKVGCVDVEGKEGRKTTRQQVQLSALEKKRRAKQAKTKAASTSTAPDVPVSSQPATNLESVEAQLLHEMKTGAGGSFDSSAADDDSEKTEGGKADDELMRDLDQLQNEHATINQTGASLLGIQQEEPMDTSVPGQNKRSRDASNKPSANQGISGWFKSGR